MLAKNNSSIKPISLKKLDKNQVQLEKYLRYNSFNWQNKTIKILTGYRQESLYPYLGIHTNHGIFYMQNGIPWLQSITDIFVEHTDIETQDWLLQCAIDKFDSSLWPIEISGFSLHNFVSQDLVRLILQGISNNNIYTSSQSWLSMFNKLDFNQKSEFNIEKICLNRNINLGSQTLSYSQYKKLNIGNIILLNNCSFDTNAVGIFNMGAFAMQIIYENNQLIFQHWTKNMSDNQNNEEWNLEEYGIENLINDNDEELQDDNSSQSNAQDIAAPEQQEQTQAEPTDENNSHPFANVPVNLNFSLGKLELSIEQLMHLQEGEILELQKPLPAQVIIYANGKKIGSGEIVEIDGSIGVQITNLYNK